MSTKSWKNQELKSLLSEAWGFNMDLGKLNEAGDPTGVESPSEYGAKKAKKSLEGEDEGEEGMEELDELASGRGYETGDRRTPRKSKKCYDKKGNQVECGSEEAIEEAHDKDWGMNKGDESHTHPGEEDYEDDAEDPKDLAHELLALAHRMGSAVGVESDVSSIDDHGGGCAMEAEEELEERRGRGRKGPHIRGPEDPRLRESVAKMRRAGYSKKQIKEFLTKAYSKALRS